MERSGAIMNVKIENQTLKFKISEEELNVLLLDKCIHTKINLLDKSFVICVNPQKEKKDIALNFVTEDDEVYISLFMPFTKIEELSNKGKCRSGIETEVNDIAISLQVDIRKDSRKVKGK